MTDTNLSHGQCAEQYASNYLVSKNYEIVDSNWNTKWCEIDIIACKDETLYFVEVKYRQNDDHGSGLDYITQSKLKQMSRAAEGWIQSHNWNKDYQLAAIEVSGKDYTVTEFVTDIN